MDIKLDDPEFLDDDLIPTRKYREVGLDLETTNLRANFGHILCACVKPVGQPVITLRLDDFKKREPWDDTPLVMELCDLLNECAKVYGWYSGKFDIKFLRTRKVLNRIVEPVTFAHADLILTARRRLLFHNNRLDTWNKSFSPRTIQKTDIEWEMWRRAAFGDKRAMNKVVEHCERDVESMEYSFLQLDPYITSWRQEIL